MVVRSAVLAGILLSVYSPALTAQSPELDAVLDLAGELKLEESGEHLVAAPRLVPDPDGGWLYWDLQGNDVRLYGRDGALNAAFGREGDGPGEFNRPLGVARLADGRLTVLDSRGRVSVWTPAGDSLLADFQSGVLRPRGFVPLGSNELAIYAAPPPATTGIEGGPLIHHLDLDDRTVTRAYFHVRLRPTDFTAVASVESPRPLAVSDSLVVVVAPLDSIWIVPLDGQGEPRSFQVASSALQGSPPTDVLSQGRAAFRSWIYESTFAGIPLRASDGGWLVQTWGLRPEGPFRGLVRLGPNGEHLWELERSPELLAVDPVSGAILLWDPESLDPATVQVFRER